MLNKRLRNNYNYLMNKRIFFTLSAILVLTLGSCGLAVPTEINVYLHLDNGESVKTLRVPLGYAVTKIEGPKRENSEFEKWYKDINLTTEFNHAWLTEPTHLYAGYNLNKIKVAELINQTTLSSVVTIEVYNTPNYFGAQTGIAQGSGVIFHEDADGYYALTNNHVTVKPQKDDYDYNQIFYVLDSDHKIKFLAERIHQLNTYDLAIIRFKSIKDYHVAPFSYLPVYAGRDVIAIGSPLGVYNQITYGKTLGSGEVELGDEPYLSNVRFPVLVHNAEIDHGSSGGPLFNHKLQVAGINFASGNNGNGQNVSVSIPTAKVFEYFQIVGGIFSDIT